MNDGRKLILASEHLRPAAAICDPELTLGLQPILTAGAGMDALTHCIEAIMSPINDPPAEAVGLDGIEKIVKNEPKAHFLDGSFSGGNHEVFERDILRSTDQKVEKIKKELKSFDIIFKSHPQNNIKIDPKYFRPCEVNNLIGDASKAREKLGWNPKSTLEELVSDMITNDLEYAKKESLLIEKGFETNIPRE